jgi:hypothetical protein
MSRIGPAALPDDLAVKNNLAVEERRVAVGVDLDPEG